jgi:CO/xanthine dehydrogenase FAD-binding subunit
MPLPHFDYVTARTIDEALAAWSDGACYFAGGTDLLPQMRAGKRTCRKVIDVKGVTQLGAIRETPDGGAAVGAAVSLAAVESHPAIRARFPVLAECCAAIGAWPLRHRATLIGNVCNASPAADSAVALLALGAWVVAAGQGGSRSIAIADFFLGPGTTALAPGELVTEVILPAGAAGARGTYLRLSRRRGMDLATVGVLVARSGNGGPPRHRVALAAVAPTPLRVQAAEAVLDAEGTATGAMHAAEIASAACTPITDVRGSAGYRREMVAVLTRRGLAALARKEA